MSNPTLWTVAVDFGTAYSKAAAIPCAATGPDAIVSARPLRVGDVAGASEPHFVPSILFLADRTIFFGPAAIVRSQGGAESKREALRSFKMLLGTNNLTAFLPTKPSRRIDPHQEFTYGELITLYLAYFLGLVNQAFREDLVIDEGRAAKWRYTRPGWFSERTMKDHEHTVALFTHAAGVRQALPERFWLTPLSYDDARRALIAGAGSKTLAVEAGVFEASAAAAAYLPDVAQKSWSLIVVDMGAGTTDFGAYMSMPSLAGKTKLFSLDHTVAVAGDDIDRALLNVVIGLAKRSDSRELGRVWRHLLPSIRDLKERLFNTGSLRVDYLGQAINCSIKDLQKNKDYKAIVTTISKDFAMIAARTVQHAAKLKLPETLVVTTGGGARLPFISEMVKKAAARRAPVRMRVAPTRPDWLDHAAFREEVEPVFHQLAIAIGGAVAPKELLIQPAPSRASVTEAAIA